MKPITISKRLSWFMFVSGVTIPLVLTFVNYVDGDPETLAPSGCTWLLWSVGLIFGLLVAYALEQAGIIRFDRKDKP